MLSSQQQLHDEILALKKENEELKKENATFKSDNSYLVDATEDLKNKINKVETELINLKAIHIKC